MPQRDDADKHVKPSDLVAAPTRTRIRSQHTAKLAIIYIRDAATADPSDVTGSRQALVDIARRWGWPDSAITIVEDLGHPGTVSPGRPGFTQLLARIDRGEVGLVLVSDVTRLSRNYLELALVSIKVIRHQVLIAVNERLYTPSARALCSLFKLRYPLTLRRPGQPRREVTSHGAQAAHRGRTRAGRGASR